MYLPSLFAESRVDALHEFIRAQAFGMLVTQTAEGLEANHVPFVLDAARGGQGVLLAHVARANPIWTQLAQGQDVLVVFRGVHGYISPNWYASKTETHRHVPTWNYEAVHVHGRIGVRDEMDFVRGVVARLTREHEQAMPQPWKMSDAPADYVAEQLAHIVGLEVEITRLEGKRKLSQNRDARDFDSTVQALQARGQNELADAMLRAKK